MKTFRRGLSAALVLLMVLLMPVMALAETTFDGTVVAGKSVSVTAPFGGTVTAFSLRVGSKIAFGDPIASIETTKVYAAQSGTITGFFGQPGDSVDEVVKRYGAVLYIVPESKYSIAADIEKAYNSTATKYVNIGEVVYIACTSDSAHKATGTITAVDGTKYTVETTNGELLMEETVNIYRSENRTSTSRIGRGDVSRTSEIAVTGTGSILYMHVKDGDTVSRGDLLFETVTDTFDGLYATSNEIVSDVSGIIASIDVTAGATVNKGTTLLTVYPEDSMQIEISIDEYDLLSVSEGDKVNILFNWDEGSESAYEGTVALISHVSSSTGSDASYKAYIDFNADSAIRLGMTVVVYADGGAGARDSIDEGAEEGAGVDEMDEAAAGDDEVDS